MLVSIVLLNRISFNDSKFLLDGQPFTIRAAELHLSRIPSKYWEQRIQLAKSMGFNTITAAIFWNQHEPISGWFDLNQTQTNISRFFELVQNNGMYLILKPGPFQDCEFDNGGYPSWLQNVSVIKRTFINNSRFLDVTQNYITHIAKKLPPFVNNLLMVQLDNKYGSIALDPNYLVEIEELWLNYNITGPFFSSDFQSSIWLAPGGAIGIAGLPTVEEIQYLQSFYSVPVFVSELSAATEQYWSGNVTKPLNVATLIQSYMTSNISFSVSGVHFGTNFNNSAGAKNTMFATTEAFQNSMIQENGALTQQFYDVRNTMLSALNMSEEQLPIPASSAKIAIETFYMRKYSTIFDQKAMIENISTNPLNFEQMQQNQGYVIYQTNITTNTSQNLSVDILNDYGYVYLRKKLIGMMSSNLTFIQIPSSENEEALLEIVVAAYGHFSDVFAQKGIIGNAYLNGALLQNWVQAKYPAEQLLKIATQSGPSNVTGMSIFQANFYINQTGDTYLCTKGFTKGYVVVNQNYLGRFWSVGPQQYIYLPGPWLFGGWNEILIFDLEQTEGAEIYGVQNIGDNQTRPSMPNISPLPKNSASKTPFMGWSSWNSLQTSITEQTIHDVSSFMKTNGLTQLGYKNIILGDGFQQKLRQQGQIVANNTNFPSGMNNLQKFLQQNNQTLGFQLSGGNSTCNQYPGSLGYEGVDAQTINSWGAKFVEYDLCNNGIINQQWAPNVGYLQVDDTYGPETAVLSGGAYLQDGLIHNIGNNSGQAVFTVTVEHDDVYAAGLQYTDSATYEHTMFKVSTNEEQAYTYLITNATATDGIDDSLVFYLQLNLKKGVNTVRIFFDGGNVQNAAYSVQRMTDQILENNNQTIVSINDWGENQPLQWAPVLGHAWRTSVDIAKTPGVSSWAQIMTAYEANVGLDNASSSNAFNNPDVLVAGFQNVSTQVAQVQMSLWCVMMAPLVIGADPRVLGNDDLNILMNEEAINVDQDQLLIQGKRVFSLNNADIVAKPLQNGSVAIVFLNKGSQTLTIQYSMKQLAQNIAIQNIQVWKNAQKYLYTEVWSGAVGSTVDVLKATLVEAHGVRFYVVTPQ